MGAPGFRSICLKANSADALALPLNSSIFGRFLDTPTDWAGLMPQVTMGSMSAASY
jgi:hypothetical protein